MDVIKKILDVARFAPSAGNRQPWIFIVITDTGIKDKLSQIHRWAYPLREAPLGILVACDKNVSPDTYDPLPALKGEVCFFISSQ
ncbi:MAG: nitroreductase family protein [Sulfolobales archaeon]